jgi:hypothetical protein
VIGMVMHGVSHSSLGNIPVIGTYICYMDINGYMMSKL